MPSIQQEIVKGLLQENTLSRKKFIELNHFNNRLLTEVLTHLANEHTWRDYQSQLDEDVGQAEIVRKINDLLQNSRLQEYYLAWGELNTYYENLFDRWTKKNNDLIDIEHQIDKVKSARLKAFFDLKEAIPVAELIHLENQYTELTENLDTFMESSDTQFVKLVNKVQLFEYVLAKEKLQKNYRESFDRWIELEKELKDIAQELKTSENPHVLERKQRRLLQEKEHLEANIPFIELIHTMQFHRAKIAEEEKEDVVVDKTVEIIEVGATTDEFINSLNEHYHFLHHTDIPEETEEEGVTSEGKEHLTRLGLFFHSIPLVIDFVRGLKYLNDARLAYLNPDTTQRQTKMGAGVVGGLASIGAGIIGALLLAGVGVVGFLAVAPIIVPSLIVGVYTVTLYRDSYILHQAQKRLEMAYRQRALLKEEIKATMHSAMPLYDPRVARLTMELLRLNNAIEKLEKAEEKAKLNRSLSAICMIGFILVLGAVFATGGGAVALGIIAAVAIIGTTFARWWNHYQENKEPVVPESKKEDQPKEKESESAHDHLTKAIKLRAGVGHVEEIIFGEKSKEELKKLIVNTAPALDTKHNSRPIEKANSLSTEKKEEEEEREGEGLKRTLR